MLFAPCGTTNGTQATEAEYPCDGRPRADLRGRASIRPIIGRFLRSRQYDLGRGSMSVTGRLRWSTSGGNLPAEPFLQTGVRLSAYPEKPRSRSQIERFEAAVRKGDALWVVFARFIAPE